jgi:hypothetical protein
MAGAGTWPSALWTYSGDWEGGRRHGRGEVVLPNGARYEGEWRNDAWHGEGVLSFPAALLAAPAAQASPGTAPPEAAMAAAAGGGEGGGGSGSEPLASGADGALQVVVRMRGRFMGNWAETQVEEAVCEPSGDIFSGPLVLGVRQGDGIVRSGGAPVDGRLAVGGGGAAVGVGAAAEGGGAAPAAGAAYWGSWADNRFEGEGRQLLPSGEDYIGQWRGGVRHGHGCWQRAAGGAEEYDGEWAEGVRHGRGTLTEGEGSKVTKGRWERGVLREDEPHHVGCTLPDGATYRGGWLKGQRHGRGRQT